MIKGNEVTWYSKLAAIIFFIGILPVLTFYIGEKYELTKQSLNYQDPGDMIVPTTITVSSSKSININSTSSHPTWKTYSDTQIGFTIQYPPDFILSNIEGSRYFKIPVNNELKNNLIKEADLWLPFFNSPCPVEGAKDPYETKRATSTINSFSGFFNKVLSEENLSGNSLGDTVFYILDNQNSQNGCYMFTLHVSSTNEQSIDKTALFKLIDEVVSTFKLTNG